MNELAKRLLAEKLVDDFYDEDVREDAVSVGDELSEQLKTMIPVDKRELLLLWEAQCAEGCGQELRRFADFVARIILMQEHTKDVADRNGIL